MKKHCPCCNEVELRIAVRRGVEIDYCPDCNGIWLDNGELNKIVAESVESVHASEVQDRGDSAKISDKTSARTSSKASKHSVLKSFFSLMGSTKDDASESFYTDNSYDTDADDDFISPSDDSCSS